MSIYCFLDIFLFLFVMISFLDLRMLIFFISSIISSRLLFTLDLYCFEILDNNILYICASHEPPFVLTFCGFLAVVIFIGGLVLLSGGAFTVTGLFLVGVIFICGVGLLSGGAFTVTGLFLMFCKMNAINSVFLSLEYPLNFSSFAYFVSSEIFIFNNLARNPS